MSPTPPSQEPTDATSRRDFMKTGGSAVVGGAVLGSLAMHSPVHAAGSDTLNVGLIGCGGRGSGAAANAMRADENAQITVMADLFKDRLDISRKTLQGRLGAKLAVTDENCFTGFDAYKRVLESDVDIVLLCTPPAFRPVQLRAAVEAGKHVFCEKPVAVDAAGVRSVLETTELAKKKNLSIVSGLCWRYDTGVLETMKRIHDGAIGDLVAVQPNYLAGPLWHRGRDESWTEMENQCRNWLYYTWLSGDHIVEQHIHSLDKMQWLMHDEPPVKCFGLGGRQVRTDSKWGNIFDHHAVCYEYANGFRGYSYTRQMADCYRETDDIVLGSKGSAKLLKFSIFGEKAWRYPDARTRESMYDLEHVALFNSIRSGKPINNGEYMSRSTMVAIMGRMACYTGQEITWDEAINSKEALVPEKLAFGDVAIPEVPMPGQTKFS